MEDKQEINEIVSNISNLLDEKVELVPENIFGVSFVNLRIAGKTSTWAEDEEFAILQMLRSFYAGLTYTYT